MTSIPWWTSSFPELVAHREPMPTVETWQTCYARYRGQNDAHFASNGWELSASHRNYEQHALSSNSPALPETHPLFGEAAPTSVSLKIIEAPAEFSVPVKQDRRLTPNFKVRVDVKYRHRVSCPITVKAYILTQQEKDSILHWYPDDTIYEIDGVQKTMTDLKGTTSVTSHFEAASASKPQQNNASSQMQEARLNAAELAASLYNQQQNAMMDALNQIHNQNSSVTPWNQLMDSVEVEQLLLANSGGFPQMQLFNNSGRVPSLAQQSLLPSAAARQAMQEVIAPEPENVLSQEIEFTNLEFVKPSRMNKVYIAFACNVLDVDLLFVLYNVPTVCICRAEQRSKACKKLGISLEDLGKFDSSVYGSLPSSATDKQHEVANKRSRPNVLNAAPLDSDTQSVSQLSLSQQSFPAQSASTLSPFRQLHQGKNAQASTAQSPPQDPLALRTDLDMLQASAAQGSVKEEPLSTNSLTQSHLRQWITEVYESTGLSRKLTQLDVQALLSHAGFPADSTSEHTCISAAQCREFTQQYMAVLSLLRMIAPVWDLENPCVISGFDMDRLGTVQALAREPAGTFIIRFSMSQPGCLVLSCKVMQGHPNSDEHGLIHAILNIKDLQERRVDTWVRDFVGATHVLDVYRQKRVDKRKIFASQYTRPRVLEALNEIVPSDLSTAFGTNMTGFGGNNAAFATLAQNFQHRQF